MNVESLRGLGSPTGLGRDDFRLGSVLISPIRRRITGPGGTIQLQPRAMQVLLCLAQHQGEVVLRRTLFEQCWGNAPVGDDSINRQLAAVRRSLASVAADGIDIETIPGTGYRLSLHVACGHEAKSFYDAAELAIDCWRLGMPTVDAAEIDNLASELNSKGGAAHEWGVLSLLCRKAAEYAEAQECSSYVQQCESAARRARTLNAGESYAAVAMTTLAPLFGNWATVRANLIRILERDPHHVPARHELAVLEMATGRPSAAVPIVEDLMKEDCYAATFHYKRIYHLWTLGDLRQADLVSTRALQLWPAHPAIWSARFWMLVFTHRADQAARMLADHSAPPGIPPSALDLLKATAARIMETEEGQPDAGRLEEHTSLCMHAGAQGPAQAIISLLSLCAIGAVEPALQLARAYYLSEERLAVPVRWNSQGPSITDQHRRVTQLLFIPATRAMRADVGFLRLCQDIGLTSYWSEFSLTPDFLREWATNPGEK